VFYRKSKPKTKKHLHKHAARRAATRYDCPLTVKDLTQMEEVIRSGKAEYVDKFSNNKKIYLVTHAEKYFKVIYDVKRASIVTCLPNRLRDQPVIS